MLSRPRTLVVSAFVASISVALVVACTGGPGGLGEFGDDGLGQSSSTQTTTSSNGSSSGRTASSTSGDVTSSSGQASSSGFSSTSGGSSGTSTSGGSSGTPTTFACGTSGLSCSSTTQYCIKPCCPTNPDCFAQDSSTTCPSGYTYGFCALDGANGCVQQCSDGNAAKCSTSTTVTPLTGRTCTTNSATRTVTCTCN